MGFDGKADRIRFPAVQADGRFSSENVTRSTGNYSGYTAFWEVRDGYLCLQRVEADVYDEVSKKEYTRMYEVKDLRPIFAAYCLAGTIQARWFSGELRAGKGDVVRYVHDGFDRNMETERVLTVRAVKCWKRRLTTITGEPD